LEVAIAFLAAIGVPGRLTIMLREPKFVGEDLVALATVVVSSFIVGSEIVVVVKMVVAVLAVGVLWALHPMFL